MFSFFWLIILWIKEAIKGFLRNFGWNIGALLLTILCMVGFSTAIIADQNANIIANNLGQKIEVQVDILKNIDENQYPQIKQRLENLPEAKQVTYISKQDAYKKVQTEMGKDADILKVLDTNPFPARFVVKLKSPDKVKQVASKIKSWNIAENVQYGEGYVEKIIAISQIIKKIGYIATIVVGLSAAYIVSSIIKLNIAQRKEEIKIKLITGSGMFTVRFPFILEALMITGVASAVVFVGLYFGYDLGVEQIKSYVPYIPLIPLQNFMKELIGWLFGLAFGIGLLGSVATTRKYLKKY